MSSRLALDLGTGAAAFVNNRRLTIVLFDLFDAHMLLLAAPSFGRKRSNVRSNGHHPRRRKNGRRLDLDGLARLQRQRAG